MWVLRSSYADGDATNVNELENNTEKTQTLLKRNRNTTFIRMMSRRRTYTITQERINKEECQVC